MYRFQDYLRRGLLLIHNHLFPGNKKLSTLMVYSTDLCNAQCKHCYIWNKKPKQTLPLGMIRKIVESRAVGKNTLIGLEGGEFMLHPECEEILQYLTENHPNFDLLSNAVLIGKLVTLVKKYPPKRLYLSLDGMSKTHDKMRNVDGLYYRVIKVIEQLKDHVPLSLMFTLTPFNDFKDLTDVAGVCKKYGIDLRVGIYGNMEYFETQQSAIDAQTLNYEIFDIPEEIKSFDENYDFMALYINFRKQRLKLPCFSVRDSIVIYPNGDIPLCQNKTDILGNLYKEPLHVIINKKRTREKHREARKCNGCWINFHRKYDIVLLRNLEKILPERIIGIFAGSYYWDGLTLKKYREFIKGE